MTIRTRMILLLLPVALAILALACAGGYALYRADHSATRLYHERMVTMRSLARIADFYDDTIHNAGLRFLNERDSLADAIKVMLQANADAFSLWKAHRETPMSGTAKLLGQEIEASMRDIEAEILQLQMLSQPSPDAAVQAENRQMALAMVNGELEPDVDRVSALYSDLADQELSAAEVDYQSAHVYLGWGLLGVLGAALGAVIGMGLLAWLITRHITRPLSEALLAHNAAGSGENPAGIAPLLPAGTLETELAPAARSRDEISAVIETLRRFRRNVADLTNLKEEQARQANTFRAQLEAIFRHAPVGVYMKDIEGHMLVVSDAAAKLWGHTHDEMIGKLDTSWSQPDEAAIIRATNQQVLESGEPLTVEYRGQAPNTYDWMMSVKFPVRDETGKIISLGGFDMDISDAKRQIEELRLAAAHLQNVKNLSHMYYWSRRVDAVSGETKDYHIDAEFSALAGRSDVSGDAITYAEQVIHPDDRARMIAIYRDFEIGKIDNYQTEYRLLRPDQRIVYLRAWVERMRDRGNGDILIAGVVMDITQEKLHEAQLMAAKSEAEASDRAKSEFLTNMSHELRTPLNAVIGFSDLLRNNAAVQRDPQLGSYVDAVNESGRSLLEIINAILDMSRLESSDLTLQEAVFPLAEAILEAERLAFMRAEGKDIHLHFPRVTATPAGIADGALDPELMIRAEPRAFRQILMNVLSNAIKFTGSGGAVHLTVAIRHGGDLMIEIADTGIGMDATLVPLLTVPFTQAGSAWTRRKGGIGLGLAIARKLLDRHQGGFEIESQPGIGTKVRLIFPAARLQRNDQHSGRPDQSDIARPQAKSH
ncbi:MAG TPA: ATP-binding protein [Candidatus Nitrosotalea sp.]|nr:ATP-binding protein [Candidatus Nitrosotalea sp.]